MNLSKLITKRKAAYALMDLSAFLFKKKKPRNLI